MICQTTNFECCRCSRVHNGAGLPAGWNVDRRQGALCDDCSGQLRKAPPKRRPARRTSRAA